MKPRFAHVIWPAGLALGLAAASLAWSQDQTQAARAQVTAAERAFARTMADRSLEDFAGYLSEEATFFGQETLRGKREVVAGWAPFFEGAQAPFSWEPDQVEVLASGTLALSTGPVRDPNGKVVARFNSVWRQEGPGVWRVVFDKGSPPDPGGP